MGTSKDMHNKTDRLKCWEYRDKFFQCIDANNVDAETLVETTYSVDKSTGRRVKNTVSKKKVFNRDGKQVCKSEEAQFEANCVASWVDYFKQRKVQELKKAAMIEELEKQGASKL